MSTTAFDRVTMHMLLFIDLLLVNGIAATEHCCYRLHASRLVSTGSNEPSMTICPPVFRCVLSVRRVSGDGPGGPRELGLRSPLAASSLQRYVCDFVQRPKGRVRLGIHKITTKWRHLNCLFETGFKVLQGQEGTGVETHFQQFGLNGVFKKK